MVALGLFMIWASVACLHNSLQPLGVARPVATGLALLFALAAYGLMSRVLLPWQSAAVLLFAGITFAVLFAHAHWRRSQHLVRDCTGAGLLLMLVLAF